MDLGAGQLTTIRKITLPLIAPGIAAAGLLAFAISIDDFVVTNFTAESDGITTDKVIERLVAETPSKEGELTRDPRFQKIFAA